MEGKCERCGEPAGMACSECGRVACIHCLSVMLHEGQSRHLVCRECRPAWEERRLHGEWRDRPPTPAELRAHHAAHATAADVSLWLYWAPGDTSPDVDPIEGPDLAYIAELVPPPGTRYRPLTADGVTCPWPVSQPEVARP